jgi:hypothetical protein
MPCFDFAFILFISIVYVFKNKELQKMKIFGVKYILYAYSLASVDFQAQVYLLKRVPRSSKHLK